MAILEKFTGLFDTPSSFSHTLKGSVFDTNALPLDLAKSSGFQKLLDLKSTASFGYHLWALLGFAPLTITNI